MSFFLKFCLFTVCGILLSLMVMPFAYFAILLFWPVIVGTLVSLGLVAILLAVLIRRIPRGFAILPILAIVSYYGLLAFDQFQLSRIRHEIGARNPPSIGSFDPDTHDLALSNADQFVRDSAIATAFSLSSKEQVSALSDEDCDAVLKYVLEPRYFGAARVSRGGFGEVCIVKVPSEPTRPLVKITTEPLPDNTGNPIYEGFLVSKQGDDSDMSLIDRILIDAYPPLPFLVFGCTPAFDAVEAECYFGPQKVTYSLSVMNPSIDRSVYPTSYNLLLGIPARQGDKGPYADLPYLMASIRAHDSSRGRRPNLTPPVRTPSNAR